MARNPDMMTLIGNTLQVEKSAHIEEGSLCLPCKVKYGRNVLFTGTAASTLGFSIT